MMITELFKIRRGEILRALYRYLPDAAGDDLLATVFTKDTRGVIQGHLRYLEGKGYVEFMKTDKTYSSAEIMAKLTTRGVDLLENSIPADPGITNAPLE